MEEQKLSFKGRLDLHFLDKQKKKMIKEHQLDCLVWECTLRSNLTCPNCNATTCKKRIHGQTDMPLWSFLRLIDSLPEDFVHRPDGTSLQVMITGGEPLLRTDLEECGRELHNRGISWGLVTNAQEMTQTRLDGLIRAGMRVLKLEITPAVYGPKMDVNSTAYSNVINTLKYAAEDKNLEFEVTTFINAHNIDHLVEIKDMLVSMGVKQWRMFSKIDLLGIDCERAMSLNEDQIEYLLQLVEKMRSENEIKIVFACDSFMGNYEKKIHKDFFFCKAGVSMATLFADGLIGVCLLNRDESCILGNIHNDDFYDVWNNRCESFLNKAWTKFRCDLHCNFHRYCKGRLQNMHHLGSILDYNNMFFGEYHGELKYKKL